MESPPYLFDQFAKMRGVSVTSAKRVLLMQGYASEGATLKKAADRCGIARSTAQVIARKFMIDFADYRPYAAREKKGEPRPQPFQRDIMKAAGDLPLFGAV